MQTTKSNKRRNWIVLALVGLFLWLAAGAARVEAATHYVTATGTGGGTSWADATSLTNALRIGQSNDMIWLEQGAYSNAATFTIASNGVSLYGGFTNGMTTFSERDWNAYPTILDGKGQNLCVVSVTGAGVTLDGLVVSNSSGAAARGISKSTAGSLVLANCRIVNHVQTTDNALGVGAQFTGGPVLMTNCVVARNSANNWGVRGFGVYSVGANLQIVDCVFSNQYGVAFDSRSATGAGLYFDQGTLWVFRTVFADNATGANHFYGGIGGGSAVYLGNHATFAASFSNCVFRGNVGLQVGTTGAGAAIWAQLNSARTAEFVNCTFTCNTNSNTKGGAFYVSSGTVRLKNSILWTNSASSGASECYVEGGTLDIRYSLLTGVGAAYVATAGAGVVTWGAGVITGDPLFASATDVHLKSRGGRWNPATGTWVLDSVTGPAIDAGDPADPIRDEPTDNGNSVINLGAYGGTAQASKSQPVVVPQLQDGGAVVNHDRARVTAALTNAALISAQVYLCYGVTPGGTSTGSWAAVMDAGFKIDTNAFTVLTPPFTLSPATTYHYRWYAAAMGSSNWTEDATFLTGAASPGGGANVIHVDRTATGFGDGSSWPHAFTNLSAALSSVSGARSNIWIPGGTYPVTTTVTVPASAVLLGGFAGTETSADGRDWSARPVILDGQASNLCVVTVNGAGVVLDGLVISNTYGSAARGISKSTAGSLVLANCRIVNHVQTTDNALGVGAQFTGGSVLMTNCVVARNSATGWGVRGFGVYSVGANLQIVDCVFSNQYGDAWSTRSATGVGLFFNQGAAQVSRTVFADNATGAGHFYGGIGGGSAVYLGSDATFAAAFSNCVFRGNAGLASGTDGAGAAVWARLNSARTAEFANCTFACNTNISNGAGGAFYVSSGTVRLKNSILWTNSASSGASECYVEGGTLDIWYDLLTGTNTSYVVTAGSGAVNWGAGVIAGDALFASATDLHLKSRTGRWNPATATWVTDPVSSPCIDAGDPADPVGLEPRPNGKCINLGAYGGTSEASMSAVPGGTTFKFR